MPRTPLPSRLTRRIAAVVATAAGVALLASGCSAASSTTSSSAAPSYGALSVQLSWVKDVEFAGQYFADSKGYYTAAGFSSVNLVAGPGATESLVASGKSLVGVSDPISAAQAIVSQQAPLKIIATTYQKNPFSILSLKNKANITTPQDLIGKRIGVQAGNESLFQALLAANHIDPTKVTVVPVQYDPSPLVNGDIDGYLAFVTNESVTLQQQGYQVQNLTYADNGLPFMTDSFEVSDDSIKNNRAALEAFLYATIKGWKDSVADPQGSADLAVKTYGSTLGLDPAKEVQQAKVSIPLITSADTTANGLLTMSQTLIDQSVATINATGVTITAAQLFDTSLLADVYQAHPELKN